MEVICLIQRPHHCEGTLVHQHFKTFSTFAYGAGGRSLFYLKTATFCWSFSRIKSHPPKVIYFALNHKINGYNLFSPFFYYKGDLFDFQMKGFLLVFMVENVVCPLMIALNETRTLISPWQRQGFMHSTSIVIPVLLEAEGSPRWPHTLVPECRHHCEIKMDWNILRW